MLDFYGKVKYYQRQMENTQKKLRQVWFNNFDDVACEVILNILTESWRRDVARSLIRDYYQEFYAISVSGSWILSQLRREEYIGDFRDEVAWGEHDWFVFLKDRGKQVVEGLLPVL